MRTPLQLGLQITIPQTSKATGAVAFLVALGSEGPAPIPSLPKDGRSWAERTSPRADPPHLPAGQPSFMPVANPPNLMQVAKGILNTITPSAVHTPKPPPTGKLAISAPGRRSSHDKEIQQRKPKSPYKPTNEHSPVRLSVDKRKSDKQQKNKPQSVQQDTGNHHSIGATATSGVTKPVRPLSFGGGGQL